MSFPSEFIKSLHGLPGLDDSRALCDALDGETPVSVRFNPYKLSEKPDGRQVPWCRYGFYLDHRPQFTLDPLMHGGAYYVQEASSMFVEHLFRSAFGEPDSPMRILDLCAAPGGKTTLLSTLAGLESTVVANEVIRTRAMTLADNVKRWGLGNVVVTNNDPSHFEGLHDWFDMVLVDAPCSGEGMFRKNPEARQQWSNANVQLCASRQRRILADIWQSLKPGGILVYSTCTFNRQENEDNVEWLASEYDAEVVEIDTDPAWGVVKGATKEGINTFRFYPHMAMGEGFFAAVVRKGARKSRVKTPKPRRTVLTDLPGKSLPPVKKWVAQSEYMQFATVGDNIYSYYRAAYPGVKMLSECLSVVYSGVLTGQLFGNKLRPEHPLALFHDLAGDAAPQAGLPLDEALEYLRKHDVDPMLFQEGINLAAFEGLPIGWIKRIGNRSNNMYPKELRITNL